MSEEMNGGKKKTPGKIMGMLGLIFGIIALICGLVAYMSVPSPDETDAGAAIGGALGGGLSMMVGGFFGWLAVIFSVIGLIIAFVKKADSKKLVIIALVISIVAMVLVMMAGSKFAAINEAGGLNNIDTSGWEDSFNDAMEEAIDEAGH